MRQELGRFVRQRRKALGLRREDVAAIASVGYDWYVRIEQGRAHASREVLQRVVEALKLDQPELEYVLRLAGQAPPPAAFAPLDAVPASVLRVMDLQEPAPAYITSPRMDVLACNSAACAFYGVEFQELPPNDRNALWLMYTHVGLRERLVDVEWHASRLVEQCRAQWVTHKSDPSFRSFIDRMSEASASFRDIWAAPLSEVPTLSTVRMVVNDPEVGRIDVEQTAWAFGEKPDHILILSAPLDDEADTTRKLARIVAMREERLAAQAGSAR